MVEIGIPFSDPLADGPVIQHSSQVSLGNGMTLKVLFSQLYKIRETVHIPLVLMGYLNPILRFGMEEFLTRCSETGIDGVIIPDMPPDEYESDYKSLFEYYGICHPLLITPHTTESRIRRIADLSGGFLYLVADASTTGEKSSVENHQVDYFRRVRKMGLNLPGLVGFGISNHVSFKKACDHASGVIIGSAFISALANQGSLEEKTGSFIRMIRTGKTG